jgi:low temperature requirement protein LtrA
VAVAHFAERYGLFVLICLGESIVGIGLGARRETLSAAVVASVALELLITIGLWWTYFDRAADAAERRLRRHEDPVLAAADAYSYLHLIIVAGIITFAVGASDSIRAIGAPLASGPRLALCGGVALYLVGLILFRLRLLRSVSTGKLLAAVALMALYAVSGGLPAWSVAAGVAVLLGGLCASETLERSST